MDYSEEQIDFNQPFRPFKDKDTPRIVSVFLRNHSRMIARYVALVDSKANIMIQLNSFIISGLIIFLEIVDAFMKIEVAALTFFVISCIASLTMATLAARPIQLNKRNIKLSPDARKEHLFDVRHFDELAKEEYDTDFNAVIGSQSLVFKNISNEFYFNTVHVVKKFKRLRYSYNVFLVGIGVTALLFVITRIFVGNQTP
ncbi:MAG: Pycsar system effector family protein [Cyclobacteriaceae bacterium]